MVMFIARIRKSIIYKLKAGAERIFFFLLQSPPRQICCFPHTFISPFPLFNSLSLTCSHTDVSYLILCLNTFSNGHSSLSTSLSPSHLFNEKSLNNTKKRLFSLIDLHAIHQIIYIDCTRLYKECKYYEIT
jgi:hypothetical protein